MYGNEGIRTFILRGTKIKMEEGIFKFGHMTFNMTAAFQPIVNLRDQKIERYEALARFKNENGLSIPTQSVIDASESYGSVGEITDFIFKLICILIAKKPDLKLSFNFSHSLLSDLSYPEKFYHQCLAHNVNPQNIEIEISEKVTEYQLMHSEQFLKQAKNYGFSVSLDDFGAGNIQVDGLARFSFDTVKIDRSIVNGIGHDPVKRRFLHTILSKMLHLNLSVICEGVEKKADLNVLKKYKDIGVQGYIFYYPLTINQLKLLEDF
jgi:EAL domain-containing protein (putative c-di-GMP-specific phosphodiesterase class I)